MNAVAIDIQKNEIERQIRSFIAENFILASGDAATIAADESLTKLGLIDSTGVLELIAFLEQEFSLSIGDEETVPENLDSVERIVAFVERKRVAA